MNDDFLNWFVATLFVYFFGWFTVGFVTMDFVWPLSTEPSRFWFVICLFIGFLFMAHRMEEKDRDKEKDNEPKA